MDRRRKFRKKLQTLEAHQIINDLGIEVLSQAILLNASQDGLLIEVQRKHVIDEELKASLDHSSLVGEKIVFTIYEMSLELEGTVSRTKHIGKGTFEWLVLFEGDMPEYWIDSLIELLPAPGEIE